MFTKRRLPGKIARDKKRAENRKVVAEGEHLIRKKLREREEGQLVAMETNKNVGQVLGKEMLRAEIQQRLLGGGGIQDEMDID